MGATGQIGEITQYFLFIPFLGTQTTKIYTVIETTNYSVGGPNNASNISKMAQLPF